MPNRGASRCGEQAGGRECGPGLTQFDAKCEMEGWQRQSIQAGSCARRADSQFSHFPAGSGGEEDRIGVGVSWQCTNSLSGSLTVPSHKTRVAIEVVNTFSSFQVP